MISQPHAPPLRNTLLAHKCHFAAASIISQLWNALRNSQCLKNHIFAATLPFRRAALQPHFAAAKWLRKWHFAAKSPMGCEIPIWLWNHPFAAKWSPSFKMAVKWSPSFKMAAKRSPSFKMAAKWSPSFEMAAKSLPSFEMAVKSPPSYEMAFRLQNWLAKWREVCENILQSQGKLRKCQ